jgi:hypothetical protein
MIELIAEKLKSILNGVPAENKEQIQRNQNIPKIYLIKSKNIANILDRLFKKS